MVDACEQVLDLLIAPVGKYRFCVINAAPAAAAVVHKENDEAFGREHLRLELIAIQHERMFNLFIRAAMNP